MTYDDADKVIDALYAEWLMAQPEACICNGDQLVMKMESGWGFDRFMAAFPELLKQSLTREKE